MHKIALTLITILNLSSLPLSHTVLLSGDEMVEVGELGKDQIVTVGIHLKDSVSVVFKLDKDGKEWLGTGLIPAQDTIKITDETKIFEYLLAN